MTSGWRDREDVCRGTCNTAWRRESAAYDAAVAARDRIVAAGGIDPGPPEPPEVRPWLRNPVWCKRCEQLIRAELAELPDLAAQLAMLPPGIRPVTGSERVKVSGSVEEPSPSPAADSLDEMLSWLRSWQRVLLDEGDVVPPYRDEATAMRKITAGLYHAFGSLITSGDGEDFGRGVRSWHRRLEAAVHEASYARHLHRPCPKCKRFTLWERPGEEYIACVYEPECGARFTRAELNTPAA